MKFLEIVRSLGPLLSALVLLVQGLLAWALWSARKEFMTQKSCAAAQKERDEARKVEAQEMDKTLKPLVPRLTALEITLENMPNDEDFDGVKAKLGEVAGEIKALVATVQGQADVMKGVSRYLDLLMQHHLKEKT